MMGDEETAVGLCKKRSIARTGISGRMVLCTTHISLVTEVYSHHTNHVYT